MYNSLVRKSPVDLYCFIIQTHFTTEERELCFYILNSQTLEKVEGLFDYKMYCHEMVNFIFKPVRKPQI